MDGERNIQFETRRSTALEVESIVVQHNPFSDVSYVLVLLARLWFSESKMSKWSGEKFLLMGCSCTLGRRGECRRQASCLCGEEVSMKSRSKHEDVVIRGRRSRRAKNMNMGYGWVG